MAIIIDNRNKNITSQKKQYGKLVVETSIKPENKSKIAMGVNKNTNEYNTQSLNNVQHKVKSDTKANAETKASPPLKICKNMEKRKLVDERRSIKLGKGQKLSLNQNVKNLSKLIVTLDFNIASKDNKEFDLDASVFMVDINNKTTEKDFIFYENTKSSCGGIVIKQDHNTSLKEAYNESIQLDLNLIPTHIQKLAFTLTIYEANERLQNFGQVSEGCFRIIEGDMKQEILNYKFSEDLSIETAMVVAEIYRYKDEWKINCIGSGFRGGLEALCNNYGIETI
ncbi:TerD family protein [Clostridium sp. CS001]|uniref:TerD family protein n=1 Tax=Clostridium sp. CS001 TaxID=2880648 RepID=UPI001CF1DE5C|nr:TerD family protein [Clostridium sp. CS001]MCB2291739.1 TerD family protein [Clostridium sp. CS001]